MALGPISTPRRSWPRSIGTPKMPTGWRPLSGKGSPSRTTGIGRRLEASVRCSSDRVDPTEEHVRCLVGQNPLIAVEVTRAGTGLAGEEAPLRVEARGEDRLLQRHPEIQHIYDRLKYGRGYARGARRPERDDAALLRGDDGRAHVGNQTLPRRERVEPSRVELWLAEGVVHRDARARYYESGPVAHACRDRDGQAIAIHAREMRRMRRAEGGEDPAPLLGCILLPCQSLGDPAVLLSVEVGRLAILERQLHRPCHHPNVLCLRHGRQLVGGDDLEHLGQRRTSCRGRAVGMHCPSTIPDAHRLPDDGLVTGEILLGNDAAHLEHVCGDLTRQFPLVVEPGPTLPDRLQRVREFGEPHLFTLEIHPLPFVEVLAGLVGEPQHLLGDPEPECRGPAQPEPFAREPDRRGQSLLHTEPAVARQELLPSPQGAWHGRRCTPDDGAYSG